MQKIYLTWKDVDDAIESLVYRIKKSGIEIDAIVGIPRGGMIPAVMLSHKLNKPLHTYRPPAPSNVLMVDDICDSGRTLEKLKHEVGVYTVTLHHKQSAVYEPSFWYSLVQEEDWIVYPWEAKDSDTVQDYLAKKKTVFNKDRKSVFD